MHGGPADLDDCMSSATMCRIIGFRSLRVAGVEHGDRVGLFGFGASAHLAIAVLRSWNCEVYSRHEESRIATSLRRLGPFGREREGENSQPVRTTWRQFHLGRQLRMRLTPSLRSTTKRRPNSNGPRRSLTLTHPNDFTLIYASKY